MPKELIYLQVSEARDKSNFIRHVHNLVHIPVTEKTTNQDLFDALEKMHDDDPEALVAVRAFIDCQFEEMTEAEANAFRKKAALDVIPEPELSLYAIFDLAPIRI